MNKITEASEAIKISREDYLKILSIISHNVKGPVMYMQYVTDYTLGNWQNLKPEEMQECAQAINESSRRISEQLVNIMNWARIQDGNFNPTLRHFNVKKSIKSELKLQKPILKIKRIKLVKNFEKDLMIKSDENIFHLAFHNILTNAIKFTQEKGTIEVTTKSLPHTTLISVKDSGVGMTADDLSLLYDDKSFSNPGTVQEQGTGFGLRIVKELIHLLKGEIEIDSEKNKGTKVTICLPN